MNGSELILVTGGTGYIGGRLVPRLLEEGYRVRVMVRDPERLQGRPWVERVEVVQGDVRQPETLPPALEGVTHAYYLIHSLGAHEDFLEADLRAAGNFGRAARASGTRRIIYLGGLGDPEAELSPHLRSRQMTGDALRQAGVPVTELRAAVIVGSGSLSFEMIRYLTERLPVMVCPRWVFTRIQPIAIQDVLEYLVQSLKNEATAGETIEIGGEDVLTYGEMMMEYARVRELRRAMIPVPVLTPRLSSYWVHWITPIPAAIARPLIEGLRNEVVVREPSARTFFPDIRPSDYRTAVEHALDRLEKGEVETIWSDALSSSGGTTAPVSLAEEQGMIIERREIQVPAEPEAVYRVFSGLGGERGWLVMAAAWKLRGILDRMVGGVGFRRGRRHPQELRVGDAIDFWRVEAVEPGRQLRLRAEMKVPGQAWLQFEASPVEEEGSLLIQTAYFAPRGLSGLLYWYLLYPLHAVIFSGMARKIAEKSLASTKPEPEAPASREA
jgi:uncharacterized protein YbjT (DUF2867 family)